MSEYLPYVGFKWLKNIGEFDVMSINEKRPIGYFLIVDLKYPDELHELHRYYPQLQKNLLFLVKCCQIIVKKIADKYEIKFGDVKKFLLILGNKNN